jgi:molecular chaperone DnaK (HSP70)/serine/threonine protein kinase
MDKDLQEKTTADDCIFNERDWVEVGRIRFPEYRVERLLGKSVHSQIYKIAYKKTAKPALFPVDTPLLLKVVHAPVGNWVRASTKEWEAEYEKLIGRLAQNPMASLLPMHAFGMEAQTRQSQGKTRQVRAGIVSSFVMNAVPLSLKKGIIEGPEGPACRPMPAEEVKSLIRKTAKALEPIHSQNMAHGALKPSNILIHENGAVLLTDWDPFGLLASIKQRDKGLENPSGLLWVAPEAMLSIQPPKQAGDIWALGALLCLLLTGRHPYPGPAKMVVESLSRQSKGGGPALLSQLPLGLGMLLSRCLDGDPSKRFASAGEFVKALYDVSLEINEPLKNQEGEGLTENNPVEDDVLDSVPVAALEDHRENKKSDDSVSVPYKGPDNDDNPGTQGSSYGAGHISSAGTENAKKHFSDSMPQTNLFSRNNFDREKKMAKQKIAASQASEQYSDNAGLQHGWWEHSPLPEALNPTDPANKSKAINISISKSHLRGSKKEFLEPKKLAVVMHSDEDDKLADRSRETLAFTIFPKPSLKGANHVVLKIGKRMPSYTIDLQMQMENQSAAFVEKLAVSIEKGAEPINSASVIGSSLVAGKGAVLVARVVLDGRKLEKLLSSQGNQGDLSITAELVVKNRKKPLDVSQLANGQPWKLFVEYVPKLEIVECNINPVVVTTVYKHPNTEIKMPRTRRRFTIANVGGGTARFSSSDIQLLPLENTQQAVELVSNALSLATTAGTTYTLKKDENQQIEYWVDPDAITGNAQSNNWPPLNFFVKLAYTGKTSRGIAAGQNELKAQFAITFENLKRGRLLAVDFGTTSSLACAYKRQFNIAEMEEFVIEDTGNATLPSVIGYFHEQYDLEIGSTPKIQLRMGKANHFGSFKRDLAEEEPYNIARPGNPLETYRADKLVADYIGRLKNRIWEQKGYYFINCVFTHPSLFSLKRKKAFLQALSEAGFSEPYLLDEASAGAMEFIKDKPESKPKKYRLLVFDFGGGTTDLTFLDVDVSEQNNERIRILDVGGDPRFGGDDVTLVIQNLIINHPKLMDKIIPLRTKQEGTIEIPPTVQGLDEKRGSNTQILQSQCETFKATHLFDKEWTDANSTYQIVLNNLYEYNSESGSMELLLPLTIKFHLENLPSEQDESIHLSRCQVEKAIYHKILAVVEDVIQMTQRHPQEEGKPTLVLLSGRSSNIPLVKEIFEHCRKGERPYWDEAKEKLSYKAPDGQGTAHPSLYCDSVILSGNPKRIVARGAARYGYYMNDPYSMELNGMGQRTTARFGTRSRSSFIEWIPAGRILVEQALSFDRESDPDNIYAWKEIDHNFSFTHDGCLKTPIEIIEYLGPGNQLDDKSRNYEMLGLFDIVRPAGIANTANGKLRIEVTTDLELVVHAIISGHKIKANEVY